MSVWYVVAVWVGASPVAALLVGRFVKVSTPPAPEKHMVTVADLVRMYDDLDAYLAAQVGDPR